MFKMLIEDKYMDDNCPVILPQLILSWLYYIPTKEPSHC